MPVSVQEISWRKGPNFACGICAAQQRLVAKRVPYDTNIEKGHRDKSNKTVGSKALRVKRALTSRTYIPAHFRKGRPLVVVLHGSMQTAEDYNRGTGWSALADLHSFALLFPEQTRSNNAIRGFNWFELDDNRRGAGEPLSIRQMIQRVVADHEIDCDRIFITGLSSGGAMTSVMLATYPDIISSPAFMRSCKFHRSI